MYRSTKQFKIATPAQAILMLIDVSLAQFRNTIRDYFSNFRMVISRFNVEFRIVITPTIVSINTNRLGQYFFNNFILLASSLKTQAKKDFLLLPDDILYCMISRIFCDQVININLGKNSLNFFCFLVHLFTNKMHVMYRTISSCTYGISSSIASACQSNQLLIPRALFLRYQLQIYRMSVESNNTVLTILAAI